MPRSALKTHDPGVRLPAGRGFLGSGADPLRLERDEGAPGGSRGALGRRGRGRRLGGPL